MKLSESVKGLIDELNMPTGFIDRFKKAFRAQEDILEDIRIAGQPLAVLYISRFMSVVPSSVSRKASEVVDELLKGTPPDKLIWLDQQLRRERSSSYYTSPKWKDISPGSVNIMSLKSGTEVSVLGLASMQHSGHVREAAVDRLSYIEDGRELPFLMVRLNDWVAPVREKARSYVLARLRPDYANNFIHCLGLLERLRNAGRTKQEELSESIFTLLQSEPCRDALLKGLESQDKLVRRKSFALASKAQGFDIVTLCKKALSQDDTVTRLWAARSVVRQLDSNMATLLPDMWSDAFMPVRRECLLGFMKLSESESLEMLTEGLMDTHSSIREFCRYYLKKRGVSDFGSFYRKAFSDGRLEIGVVAGLGETGSPDDIPLIKKILSDGVGRIRRVAVVALGRLLKDDATVELLPFLADKNLVVSRIVWLTLKHRIGMIDIADLWQLYKTESRTVVKTRIVQLLGLYNRWLSLPYLIQVYCEDDSGESQSGEVQLRLVISEWNRSFVRPSEEQVESVRTLIDRYSSARDYRLLKSISGYIEGYEK